MAALTPVASVEALVGAIQRSGLLSAEAIEKVRIVAAKSSDPKHLVRDLLKDGTLTKWQAGQLLHGYHQLTIDKYKLLDQLSSSPTGRIYLVEHAQMGRRHTLKVLAKRLASNPKAVKQFLEAAQNACGLDHRNISHVYDVSQDGDRNYVVMDYIEGETLEQLIERDGPVKLPVALDFIAQAAEGLAHAHENGVVHGDLKPGNLLRDHAGIIKILEMGQAGTGATFETEGPDESVEMAALAAVIFQAPELRGDGEAADVACDVYSLGSVLCFLLTGKAARNSETAVQQLSAVGGLPPPVIELCGRLMSDKPSERPKTIVNVLEQLAAATQQPAVTPEKANGAPEVQASETKEKASDKTPAAAEKPAKEKGKKTPPVAKSLDDEAPIKAIVADDPFLPRAATPPEPFAIKTKGRIGKKPAAKGDKPKWKDAPEEPADEAKKKTFFTPLIVAGAIGGGGVLVLSLIIAIVCVMAFSSGKQQVAQAKLPKGAVAQADVAANVEAESNPAAPVVEKNPEVNPVVETKPDETPAPGVAPSIAIEPKKVESSAPVSGSAAPQVKTPESVAPGSPPEVKKEPEPETKPEPKSEPPPPKTAPKPAPPKAAPPASPFKGLAKAVTLRNLPDGPSEPAEDAVQPITLGPCKLGENDTLAVTLLGGDGAIRINKQKFELAQKAGSAREWNFMLTGGSSPIAIAGLTVKEGELVFQWTEEGVKQASVAKQLGNCALDLAAGSAKHTLALRTPVQGQPLVVEIDKAGAGVKWNIGDLPVAKQVFVEVTRPVEFKIYKQEPKNAVPAGDTITVWTGPTDKSVPLALKLTTTSNARGVNVALVPHARLEGQEQRLYRKKELIALQQQVAQELPLLDIELKKTKDSRPTRDPEKLLKEQRINQLANEQATRTIMLDQINYITGFTEKMQGAAQVHFRVYYLAGNAKVDLLRTEPEEAEKAK